LTWRRCCSKPTAESSAGWRPIPFGLRFHRLGLTSRRRLKARSWSIPGADHARQFWLKIGQYSEAGTGDVPTATMWMASCGQTSVTDAVCPGRASSSRGGVAGYRPMTGHGTPQTLFGSHDQHASLLRLLEKGREKLRFLLPPEILSASATTPLLGSGLALGKLAKPRRKRHAQPTETPIACAVCGNVSANSSGNTTASPSLYRFTCTRPTRVCPIRPAAARTRSAPR
jgi:hypothetical protein